MSLAKLFLLPSLDAAGGGDDLSAGRPGGAAGGDQGTNGPTDGLVAGRQVWHVHPLGTLCHSGRRVERRQGARPRRVDPVQRQDPGTGLRQAPAPVQPGQVRREEMGRPGQARGREVHRHHEQAPRRVLPLRQQADRLRRDGHALRPRSPETAGRRVPSPGHQDLLLPLDPRLAPAGRQGQGLPQVRRAPPRPASRASDQLRADRRALVRRRVDTRMDRRARPRPGEIPPFDPAGPDRQQPRRQAEADRPATSARRSRRSRPPARPAGTGKRA